MTDGAVKYIPVDEISPNPRNPRQHFDDDKIAELAESIDKQGLLQAILVRPHDNEYELVHGERRLRAHKHLDKDTIKAEVRVLTAEESLEISITENLQREDINPLEEAQGYKAFIDEFDLTQTEAAERLGKSQSHIANQLGLLKLPEILQRGILHKILSPWQARTLKSVWGEYWLYDLTVDHQLSVSELRDIIEDLKNGADYARVVRKRPIEVFEDSLSTTEELAEMWDLSDEERERLTNSEFTHYRLWANKHIEGFNMTIPGLDYIPEDRDPETFNTDRLIDTTPKPVVYDILLHKVIVGYRRIRLAIKDHGYDGDIRVEYIHHRSIFEWEKRIPDDTPDELELIYDN